MLLYRYWWSNDDSWFWQWWNDQRFTTLLIRNAYLKCLFRSLISWLFTANKATCLEEDCWGSNTTPSFCWNSLMNWSGIFTILIGANGPRVIHIVIFDSGAAILLARSWCSFSPFFVLSVGWIRSFVGTTLWPYHRGGRFFIGASWISAAIGRLV